MIYVVFMIYEDGEKRPLYYFNTVEEADWFIESNGENNFEVMEIPHGSNEGEFGNEFQYTYDMFFDHNLDMWYIENSNMSRNAVVKPAAVHKVERVDEFNIRVMFSLPTRNRTSADKMAYELLFQQINNEIADLDFED